MPHHAADTIRGIGNYNTPRPPTEYYKVSNYLIIMYYNKNDKNRYLRGYTMAERKTHGYLST